MTDEVTSFLVALHSQHTEQKLFQFLNGLDESYSTHRSHILLMQPLPSVDEAYNFLQQEESQREVLQHSKAESDSLVMYGKSTEALLTCTACGKIGHSKDKWLSVIGYPSWHSMSQPLAYRARGGTVRDRGGRWPRGSRGGRIHIPFSNEVIATPSLSPAQVEQLMKLLPSSTSPAPATSHEEEFDPLYAGMAVSQVPTSSSHPWILDSGASDHMTVNLSLLSSTKPRPYDTKITLPNGYTSSITCSGHIHLSPTLTLLNVLHVPIFKHNLLSIPKLTKDTGCHILFSSDSCYIIIKHTTSPILFGKLHHGLYYFHPSSYISSAVTTPSILAQLPYTSPLSSSTLWNCRLGHAPHAKISLIPHISHPDTCLTCPLPSSLIL